MTVGQLIAWLSQHDPDTEVFIHDADTGGFMPVHSGDCEEHGFLYRRPENAIFLHGTYGDMDWTESNQKD